MSCLRLKKEKCRVLLLGAFASGKTTIMRGLMHKNFEKYPLIPTLGMYIRNVIINHYKVEICDFGGSKELLNQWQYLFGEIHGFMFVIDSTDIKNILTNKKSLWRTLEHQDVEGKPFLIIVTKTDCTNTMDEDVMYATFDIEAILAIHKNVQICFSDPQRDSQHLLDFISKMDFKSNRLKSISKRTITQNFSTNQLLEKNQGMDDGWTGVVNQERRDNWDGLGFAGLQRHRTEGHGTDDGQGTDGQGTNGQGMDGQGMNGQGTNGQGTDGQETDGQRLDAQNTNAHNANAQEMNAQGTNAQGTDAQGTDGQGTGTSLCTECPRSSSCEEFCPTDKEVKKINTLRMTDEDEDEETLFITVLKFTAGVLWLLEFIESNKAALEARIETTRTADTTEGRLEKKYSKKELIKLHKTWLQHFKKDIHNIKTKSFEPHYHHTAVRRHSHACQSMFVIQTADNMQIMSKLLEITNRLPKTQSQGSQHTIKTTKQQIQEYHVHNANSKTKSGGYNCYGQSNQ